MLTILFVEKKDISSIEEDRSCKQHVNKKENTDYPLKDYYSEKKFNPSS